MAISFALMPQQWRVPGVYVEFSNEQAIQGIFTRPYRVLVIGQRLSSGTVAELVPTGVTRSEQARDWFGRGSMIERMIRALRLNNAITETVVIALDDNDAGVAAQGEIAFTGTPSAAGTLNLYIGGQRVQVAVSAAQTAASIASAIASAINANLDLPVTASATDGDVALTARHKGEVGNDIDIRFNYYVGEVLPAGLPAPGITAMAGGSGNPLLSDVIAVMGEEQYDIVVHPYLDGVNLLAMKTELDDRWGPLRQIEGHAISAMRGTHNELTTFGATQNDPHLTVIGADDSPTPTYEWAAALGGVAAYFLNIDPARPLQTLPMRGVLAPVKEKQFTKGEQNVLLYDGIATYTVDADGTVRVQRAVSTYQTNAAGGDDPSYLDIQTMFTLGVLRYTFRNWFLQRYPRHKLGDDGTRYGPGQAVLTPGEARAQCHALFRFWEEQAWVENFDQFKRDLIVERDPQDRNRLNFLLPPDLINQARVLAAKLEFRL